jgi:hypothetical protein
MKDEEVKTWLGDRILEVDGTSMVESSSYWKLIAYQEVYKYLFGTAIDLTRLKRERESER